MSNGCLFPAFEQDLEQRLAALQAQGLARELRQVDSPQGTRVRVGGRTLLNFSSNDYLGLANAPELKEATKTALDAFGAGSGASRLVCGSLSPHHRLEEALAEFKGTAAALSFCSGYTAVLGVIGALLEPEDVLVTDQRVHACVVDAARLCKAHLRIYAHNDLNELQTALKWTESLARDTPLASRRRRILIVTESVFSMDGDLASLREIVDLKDKHGAWLMLDEAHATGLYGEHRRGLAEAYELSDRIEIQMGTLGKALGAAGGYIAGSRQLSDFLVNRARSFIFSTAPVPAAAAAATAAIRLIQSPEGETRRQQLWQRVDATKNALIRLGWKLPAVQSAIIPMRVGAEAEAVALAAALRERGLFIPAIRYPSVDRGAARLRLTVSAAHTPEDIEELADALAEVIDRLSHP